MQQFFSSLHVMPLRGLRVSVFLLFKEFLAFLGLLPLFPMVHPEIWGFFCEKQELAFPENLARSFLSSWVLAGKAHTIGKKIVTVHKFCRGEPIMDYKLQSGRCPESVNATDRAPESSWITAHHIQLQLQFSIPAEMLKHHSYRIGPFMNCFGKHVFSQLSVAL